MTAIDDWIAELLAGRYSDADQNLRSQVSVAVAALLAIQGGLAPSGPEAANSFFAGPITGAPALPTFRAIDVSDLNAPLTAATLAAIVMAAAGRLSFGGVTASFPALQRSGTALQAELADGSGTANFIANQLQPSQTAGILGTTTNNNANAGSVGEWAETVTTFAAPVALATGTAKTIAQVDLQAGDYDVGGQVQYKPAAGTTTTDTVASLSLTTNTLDAQELRNVFNAPLGAGLSVTLPLARRRFSLAAPASVFLIGYADFAVSTAAACGFINARRMR